MITSIYIQESTNLVITAAQLCAPTVPGCSVSKILAIDLTKDASVAVAVVDADLSRWITARVLFRWVASWESSSLCWRRGKANAKEGEESKDGKTFHLLLNPIWGEEQSRSSFIQCRLLSWTVELCHKILVHTLSVSWILQHIENFVT